MIKGSDNRSKQSEKQGIRGDKEKKERRKINIRERNKRIGREKEKKKKRFSRHSDGSTVREEKSIHATRDSVGTKILEFHQTP